MQPRLRVAQEREQRKCPYLDTVDRKVLDFDLEKVWCNICISEIGMLHFSLTQECLHLSSLWSIYPGMAFVTSRILGKR